MPRTARIGLVLLASAWLSAVPIDAALAATLTVTKTIDSNDGQCNVDCSLREAIIAANAAPGADSIRLPAGTYELTHVGADEDAAATGDLDITSTLDIKPVSGLVTIEGEFGDDRLIDVRPTGRAKLSGLRLSGGTLVPGFGGGIRNRGTLTLIGSVVDGNFATGGAGISNDQGTATITRSLITGNHAFVGDGGGIHSSLGSLTLIDSSVTGNETLLNGGGIAIGDSGGPEIDATISGTEVIGNTAQGDGAGVFQGEFSAGITVSTSTISNNVAEGTGGGIANAGAVSISKSDIANNAAASGGGIASSGPLTLSRSSVSHNQTTVPAAMGGGVAMSGGSISDSTIRGNGGGIGGGIAVTGTATVERTLILGNFAGNGAGVASLVEAVLTLRNATITRNVTTADTSKGGGLYKATSASANLTSVTIVENESLGDDGEPGDGGGVYAVAGTGVLNLTNSIVAQNEADTTGDDCFGPIFSGGHNIIGGTAGCTVNGQLPSDSVGAFTGYSPLSGNGGPTETFALPVGSSAAEHGPIGAGCSGTDQRGVPRTSPCSTGAYEQVFCGGVLVNIVGTNGRNRLRGTQGNDSILALGGNDTVFGGPGGDKLCGGSGNDTLYGQSGNDFLNGGSGNDVCVGGSGTNVKKSC